MDDKPTYSQAIEELEVIISEIENEDILVDELSAKVKRASWLIGICKEALNTTEEEIKHILAELNRDKPN